MSKKTHIEQLSTDAFEGNIDTLIEKLQSIKEDYKDKFDSLFIEYETIREYYGDYESYVLYGVKK